MSKLVAVEYKHNEHNTMMIDWYIGKRCNFSCSYCADFIHDNYSAHVPFEKMKIFVDKIVERYGINIHWSLTGGEPTLNPHFIQLLEYLQDKKYHISVCTNGSRSIDYLIKMYELVDNITYSMHFEHITPKLDEYKEKAIILENWRKEWNKTHLTGWELGETQPKQFIARFMVLPGFNEEIHNLTQYFKSQDVERIENRVIRPQKDYFLDENKEKMPDGSYRWKIKTKKQEISAETKVSPNQDNIDDFTTVLEREERWYSEEDRKTLVEMYKSVKPERKWLRGYIEKENGEIATEDYHYNSLNYEYKTNFKGWTCYAGVTLLKVAPNGDIFVANCFQGGPLANIYTLDNSVQLPKEPIICQKERCTDPMDLRQKKYLNNEYKNLVNANTDTLCVAPQINVFVSDITNKFSPCCVFDNSKNTNNFKTITEYLESDFLKEIKNSLSNNQWPSTCNTCKNKKELNLDADTDYYKRIVKNNNFDLTKIEKPILLDFRPGNKCNLKCRMCFPSGSNLIEEEFNQNKSMKQYSESLSNDNSNFNDIINYIKENKIHTLKILGGEPTIDEKVAKLLDNITKDDCIEILKFTTNATNLNSKFQKHFSKFSHVNITFSLDAVGKTYEYIRTNSNFSKVEKNIYNTMTTFSQYSYSFNVVLTPYNIFNLVDLVKWFVSLEQDYGKFDVNFSHSVANYTHLSAVPSAYVRSTLTELKSLQKLYPNFYKIKDLIALLDSVKFKRENFEKFVQYNHNLDNIRKTSIIELDKRFITLTIHN